MSDDRSVGRGRPTAPERDGGTDDSTPGDPLQSDRFFDVLADGRRRTLVRYLAEREGDAASTVELVDHVASREDDAEVDGVAVSLYGTHLPALADAGIVEYDRRSRTVRYRGGDPLDDWLDVTERGVRE